MIEKTASVHPEGPSRKGKGRIGTETRALERYPHAFARDKVGFAPGEVDAQARVRPSPHGGGFAIVRIALAPSAAAAGIGLQATLEAAAP